MLDPYNVLNVDQEASDQEIKQSYLKLVQKYTPDRDPEKFQQIRSAYEKISTLYNRLSFDLLASPLPSKEDIYHLLTEDSSIQHLTEKQLIDAITISARNTEEQNVNNK